MASARKSGGFQGFVDSNGKRLDFFQQLDQIKMGKKPQKKNVGVSGKSGYSVSGVSGYNGMTGFTSSNETVMYIPPKENNKERNKIKFDIQKIN